MPKVSETDLSERRTDILRGARECFVTHGYDGATVSRLEKETGKSRGAIFHHYRNKETLFREVAHRDMLRMTELASEQGMIGLIRYLLEDPSLPTGGACGWRSPIGSDDEQLGSLGRRPAEPPRAVTARLEEQRTQAPAHHLHRDNPPTAGARPGRCHGASGVRPGRHPPPQALISSNTARVQDTD